MKTASQIPPPAEADSLPAPSSFWRCSLAQKPSQILIGQKLEILCEGEKAARFSDRLEMVFPEEKDPPWLYIVQVIHKTPSSVRFEAVPWKTGRFHNIPFLLTDGQEAVQAGGLSLDIESVLDKSSASHPPFGPWREPWPPALVFSSALSIALLAAAALFFLRSALKRKRFIQSIDQRMAKTKAPPSVRFVISLREKTPLALADLEELFQVFLEEALFIPALEKDPEVFLKEFKKHYKTESLHLGKKAAALLQEIQSCKQKGLSQAAEELKEGAIDMAFELEDIISGA